MLDYRRKLFLGVTRVKSVFADTLGNEHTGTGTGFWLQLASGNTCFVTNRHNVDPRIRFPDKPDLSLHNLEIELRRHVQAENSKAAFTPETQFFEVKQDSTLFVSDNSDCAIGMIEFKTPNKDFPVFSPFEECDLATEDFFQNTLAVAHELYFIGFAGRPSNSSGEKKPVQWWDTKWNFPIARSAEVASMPFLPFKNAAIHMEDVLLVSGMSFSGSSGSPVISREIGFRTKPPVRAGGLAVQCDNYSPERLIGIMSGHFQFRDDRDVFEHGGLSYLIRSTSILHLIKSKAL